MQMYVMVRSCPYKLSKLRVSSSSSEQRRVQLCVMLQRFKRPRLQQPASCQRTLSALDRLRVSILSTCKWQN